MPLKKNSYTFVRNHLRRVLRQAHLENMALGSNSGLIPRERAATRIDTLEELCRTFDVRLIEMKRCGLCANTFPNLGAGRIYCSDACRQAAYRLRNFQ